VSGSGTILVRTDTGTTADYEIDAIGNVTTLDASAPPLSPQPTPNLSYGTTMYVTDTSGLVANVICVACDPEAE
jgi:hypothetical protein